MHVFERFRSPHTEQLSLCSPFILQSIFSAKHNKKAHKRPQAVHALNYGKIILPFFK